MSTISPAEHVAGPTPRGTRGSGEGTESLGSASPLVPPLMGGLGRLSMEEAAWDLPYFWNTTAITACSWAHDEGCSCHRWKEWGFKWVRTERYAKSKKIILSCITRSTVAKTREASKVRSSLDLKPHLADSVCVLASTPEVL